MKPLALPPLLAFASLFAAHSPSLHAQTDTAKEVVRLDQVEVTDARLATVASSGILGSQPLVDTPYSISVVGREDLERWQPKTLGEAFFTDPSVVSNVNPYASGWRERLKVRGLALNWNNYRLNGLPVETTTLEWPFELMEQVELLKGANGFMHGFGVPGGMVNYRTKQPLAQNYTAFTTGWYSDTAFTLGVDASRRAGPDGWLGYRVNLGHEFGDTYNNGSVDRSFGSVAIAARVTARLQLTAELIHIDKSMDHESPIVGFDYGNGVFAAGSKVPTPTNPSDSVSIDGTFDDVTNTVALAGLHYRFGPDWDTSATYSFFRARNDINKVWYSLTNTAGDYSIYNYQLSWDEADSHYFQSLTQGRFATGPLSHRIAAGAAYKDRKTYHSAYDWRLLGTGNLYTGNVSVAPFPAHSKQSIPGLEYEEASLFASDTVDLASGWSALLGLRYNDYRQQLPGGAPYTATQVTPTYALIYRPRAGWSLYASYVESLEAGSTVGASSGGLPYTNAGQVLPPLTSEQLEAGLKYEGSRWAAGLAAFRLERGANLTRTNGDGTVTLLQDGISLYQGIELSGQGRLTDALSLNAGFIWLDAIYDRLSTSSASLENNRIAGSARQQAALQAVYKVPALSGFEVFGGARYFGDCFYDNANHLAIPGYTLYNLGLGYATVILGHRVSLHAQANNLTDKRYWSSAGLGAPRTYALSAKLEW